MALARAASRLCAFNRAIRAASSASFAALFAAARAAFWRWRLVSSAEDAAAEEEAAPLRAGFEPPLGVLPPPLEGTERTRPWEGRVLGVASEGRTAKGLAEA